MITLFYGQWSLVACHVCIHISRMNSIHNKVLTRVSIECTLLNEA